MANRRSLANRRGDASAPLRPYPGPLVEPEVMATEDLVLHDVVEARQHRPPAPPPEPVVETPAPPVVIAPTMLVPTHNRRSLANRRNDADAPLRPYPGPLVPPPEPSDTNSFCDYFERSTIGPDWELLPYPGEENHNTWLIDGHAVSETNAQFNLPAPGYYTSDHLLRVGDFSTAQWCEATFDNMWPPLDEHDFGSGLTNYYPRIGLHLNVSDDPTNLDFLHEGNNLEVVMTYNTTTTYGYAAYLSPRCGETYDPTMWTWTVPADSVDETTQMTLRVESDGINRLRAYVDGDLVMEQHTFGYEGGPANGLCQGDRIGIRAFWGGQATPGNPNPVPTVGPRVLEVCGGELEASAIFCDHFDRADGPVGSNWVQHPDIPGGGALSIDDGAAVAPLDLLSTVMYWHEVQDTQRIEMVVENVLAQYAWLTLHVNMSATDYASRSVEFEFYSEDELWVQLARSDGVDVLAYVGPLPLPAAEPVTLGLESAPDGTFWATVNGVVVVVAVDPDPPPGQFVGVEIDPSAPETSPRILSICGGELTSKTTWSDDFERADGAVGTNWMVAPENDNYDWVEVPMMILGGAAIAPEMNTGDPDDAFGSAQWAAPLPGDQFVELCVTGLSYGTTYPAAQRMGGQIRLFCQGDPVTHEREELWVVWSDSTWAGGGIRLDEYWYNTDGSYGDSAVFVQTTPWASALADPTVCLRLECDMDGAVRVYMDVGTAGATTLIGEGVSTGTHRGPFMGMRMMWYSLGASAVSPRVLWARGGEL